MKKERIEKIKKYIKDDRPKKLRNYTRKHKINLKDVVLKKNRNLLHYCCRHGSGSVLRYLLQEDVNAAKVDGEGSLPLHAALASAINYSLTGQAPLAQESYYGLVVPLLERFPQHLQVRNRDDLSSQELLNRLLSLLQSSSATKGGTLGDKDDGSDDEEAISRNTRERMWREKLSEELHCEEAEMLGGFYDEDLEDLGLHRESYDEWADRIAREKRAKHHREKKQWTTNRGQGSSPPNQRSSSGKRKHTEEASKENLEDIRAKMRKKFEEKRKEEREEDAKKKKDKYEKHYQTIFGLVEENSRQLNFSDIPWPSSKGADESVAILFCDLPKGTQEYKKYLREQQIRWHPDKFSQRFGNVLSEEDRTRILERVTLISQALNKLSE